MEKVYWKRLPFPGSSGGCSLWERLKACPQCGWSFYDYSRNRSATWCSMSLCGNRLKTRAYRRRSEKRR